MTTDAPMRFDWRHPNYLMVFQQRTERLQRICSNPQSLPTLKGPD
ncbi:MAG: hypothetical protein ACLPKT_14035 [Methylocella sp.]